MSVPLIEMLPDFGCSRPRICRNNVLFPEPLPPSRTVIWPGSMSRFKPSSTRRPSYSTTRSRTEIMDIYVFPTK